MDLAGFQQQEGLTLSTLADRLGRPVSTVHGWLSGSRKPDWASLEAIVAATDGAVTADDFLATRPHGLSEMQVPLTPVDPALREAATALGVDVAAVFERCERRCGGKDPPLAGAEPGSHRRLEPLGGRARAAAGEVSALVMPRFDAHPALPEGFGYLLNVQTDLLDHLRTRVVVPLLPPASVRSRPASCTPSS